MHIIQKVWANQIWPFLSSLKITDLSNVELFEF